MRERAFLLDGSVLAYMTDKKSDLTKQVAKLCGFILFFSVF